MTWLLKVETETRADAEKIEKVIDSMSRGAFKVDYSCNNHPIKLIDIEYEELDED